MKSLRLIHQASRSPPLSRPDDTPTGLLPGLLHPLERVVAGHRLGNARNAQRADRGHEQADRLQIERNRAVGGYALVLRIERAGHVGRCREIGRPVAVAEDPQVGGHVLAERRRGVRVRLFPVVERIAVLEHQVGQLAAVDGDVAAAADEAAGCAQLVAVLSE